MYFECWFATYPPGIIRTHHGPVRPASAVAVAGGCAPLSKFHRNVPRLLLRVDRVHDGLSLLPGVVVCKAGKVQDGGYVVPDPHVLGRTATRCRVHWGPVSGWWCGPSRVHPWEGGREIKKSI